MLVVLSKQGKLVKAAYTHEQYLLTEFLTHNQVITGSQSNEHGYINRLP